MRCRTETIEIAAHMPSCPCSLGKKKPPPTSGIWEVELTTLHTIRYQTGLLWDYVNNLTCPIPVGGMDKTAHPTFWTLKFEVASNCYRSTVPVQWQSPAWQRPSSRWQSSTCRWRRRPPRPPLWYHSAEQCKGGCSCPPINQSVDESQNNCPK